MAANNAPGPFETGSARAEAVLNQRGETIAPPPQTLPKVKVKTPP